MEKLMFRQIREKDLPVIMYWRMLPQITKYMCTDPQLTLDDQERWFQKIIRDDSCFHWIFDVGGRPVGMVSLSQWDKENSVIHSGAYIAEQSARSLKNIIDMNMNLFAYAIERLKVNRISIEILGNNTGQIRWLPRFGAVKEGILRQAIKKNDA